MGDCSGQGLFPVRSMDKTTQFRSKDSLSFGQPGLQTNRHLKKRGDIQKKKEKKDKTIFLVVFQ